MRPTALSSARSADNAFARQKNSAKAPHESIPTFARSATSASALRKLFEQHAQKDELAKLDTIYQALTESGRVRHALGHDIVALKPMTGQLGIIKHGNSARGAPTETTWKTSGELVAPIREIDGIPDALARLTIAITLRMEAAGKNPP